MLWETKQLMIKDLIETINNRIDFEKYDIDGIKSIFRTYITYYFESSNVFKFFYLFQLDKPKDKENLENNEMQPDFNQMWQDTFKEFIDAGKITVNDLEVIAKILIYSMHGMLTLNFSYYMELSKELVYKDLNLIVDYLVKK